MGESFMLQNGYVRAEFSKDGILQTITTIDDRKKERVNLVRNFMTLFCLKEVFCAGILTKDLEICGFLPGHYQRCKHLDL